MDFFPGLKAMENYHPLFVHFPVVLLPLALVGQALALWRPRPELERLALWLRRVSSAIPRFSLISRRQCHCAFCQRVIAETRTRRCCGLLYRR